jgi:hypothetical protein
VPDGVDYFQIQNLLHRYSDAVDRGDFATVGKMFEHADVYFPGEMLPSVRKGTGHFEKQLTAWTRVYPETGNPRTRHLCTNPIIDFDDDGHARCQSYYAVFQEAPGLPLQCIITGSYLDRFEKVAGSWRFAERRETVAGVGNLSAHLLQSFAGPTGE